MENIQIAKTFEEVADLLEIQGIKASSDHGVLLEINAQPDRLDLNDLHIAMARAAGVKLVVSTDAHRVQELDFIRFGVDQARRGWCESKDIANTCHLAALQKLLQK